MSAAEWFAFALIAAGAFRLATVIGYPPSYRRRKQKATHREGVNE